MPRRNENASRIREGGVPRSSIDLNEFLRRWPTPTSLARVAIKASTRDASPTVEFSEKKPSPSYRQRDRSNR